MKKQTNEDAPVEIVPDEKYSGMFRLKWADGVLSEDLYNWTRVNDIMKNYQLYRYNMKKGQPEFNNIKRFVSEN